MDNKGKKHPGGRPGFENTAFVGLKMPAALEQRLIDKVAELKAKGYKTTKSELIRLLAEYWLDDAEDIFAEKRKAS